VKTLLCGIIEALKTQPLNQLLLLAHILSMKGEDLSSMAGSPTGLFLSLCAGPLLTRCWLEDYGVDR